MTDIAARHETASRFTPSFFFWMTLAMCFFVFGGFGMTYLFPLAKGSFPPAPPIVRTSSSSPSTTCGPSSARTAPAT